MAMRKHIWVLVLLASIGCGTLNLWAANGASAKSYYYRPTEYWDTCQNYMPVDWRKQQCVRAGTYRDTVIAKQDTTILPPDTTLNPMQDTTFTPYQDTILTPYPDTTITPYQDTTITPYQDTTLTPYQDTTLTPYQDTTVVPYQDTVVTTRWDTIVSPTLDTTVILVHDTTIQTLTDTIIQTLIDTTVQTRIDTTIQTLLDTTIQTLLDTTIQILTDTTIQTLIDTTIIFWTDTIITPVEPLITNYPDTVYMMELQVFVPNVIHRAIELPKGSSIVIRGKLYAEEGVYWDTIPSTTPCDSVLHLVIRWAETYHQYDTLHVCDGYAVQWRGKSYSSAGTYFDSLTTVQGHDSIFQLNLLVHYPTAQYDTARVCQVELPAYRWHNRSFSAAGDYTDMLTTKAGCDSLFYLHLEVLQAVPTVQVTRYFCENGSFTFKGKTYSTEMFFVDSLVAANHCDSVIEYHYVPRPQFFHEDFEQHFAGQPVLWRGRYVYDDGVYQDTLVNQYGCDSIYQLRVATKYNFYQTITRCEGDTVMLHKRVIDHNCTVDDTLKTSMGADSIGHYTYNFIQSFYAHETITICSNEYVEWVGHLDKGGNPIILHEEGLYTDRHRNMAGCDSTYEIEVKHAPAYLHDTVVIICNDTNDIRPVSWTDSKGKTWTFHQHNLDTTIVDTMRHTVPQSLPSAGVPASGGCDSIFRFRVIITDRCSELDSFPLCRGEQIRIDGKIYTQPGYYSNKMPSKTHPELGLPDSTHNFMIYQVEPDVVYDTIIWCESHLPAVYYGRQYGSRQSNDYVIPLKNMYHCDSIVHLHVQVIPTVYSPITTYEFCPEEVIYVRLNTGKVYTHPGSYNDTVSVGLYGCDSIIRIQIKVRPSFYHQQEEVLPQGGQYIWYRHHHDTVLTQPGVYYDSLKNSTGCDSVYQLRLVPARPYYNYQSTFVCANQLPLEWHNKQIYTSGSYFDSLKTVHQLDSVYQLDVTVRPIYDTTIYINLCSTDYFGLRGQVITASGVYNDTLVAVNACDSIVRYVVNFTSLQMGDLERTYCAEHGSVVWRGQTYSKEGYYFDTLRTTLGCDSFIYRMYLSIQRPYLFEDTLSICQNELPYTWRGKQITADGVYDDSLQTWFGLDSIYRVHASVVPTYFSSFHVLICKGESYNFGNQSITTPGAYLDKRSSKDGCDSTIRCVVNYAPSYLIEETQTFVDSTDLPILWHGQQIWSEGYYMDSLRTAEYGCDSVHRLHVIQHHSYLFVERDSACDDELPYVWRGQQLTSSGTYYDKYSSVGGLDSIYQIDFHINASRFQSLQVMLCQGQTYYLNGKPLTQVGVYRDTLLTDAGCHDITEVIISRPTITTTTVRHILCQGDSLFICGKNVTSAGNYYETLTAHLTGCDSIVHHIVSMGSTFWRDEKKTINQGDTYTWHRQGMPWVLSQQGVYFDSCQTVWGCDSIYRLELTVNQTEYIFPMEQQTVCSSSLPYVWRNKSLTQSGVYYDSLKTKLGKDSVYSLQLTVYVTRDSLSQLTFCDGDRPTINGITYTQNASFVDTLISKDGCDSVRIHYVLNFHQRYSIKRMIDLHDGETYVFGDTVIATSGIYYRHFLSVYGCDSMVTLHVSTCPTMTQTTIRKNMCEGETFFFNGQPITTSGLYYVHFTTALGCDSLVCYQVNFYPALEDHKVVFICQGESYTWKGHFNDIVLYKQGLYVDSIPTASGCYDVYSLQLCYKPNSIRDTVVEICEDQVPYLYKGSFYYRDSVFMDTLSNNYAGCDSILRWHMRINHHCSEYEQWSRCTNETIYVAGLLISHSGAYAVNRLTAQGEDSVYRFIVHDVEPYEVFTQLEPACDSVRYGGHTYYARGAANETFTVDLRHITQEGCDSLEHVQMTIYSSSPKHVHYATIADYQTYRFEGQDYKAPGVYPVQYFNAKGCDSIEELHLTVLTTQYMTPLQYDLCASDNAGIEIFGKLYKPKADTLVSDTLWQGNQPIIRTAIVNMHLPFRITSFNAQQDQIVCSDKRVAFYVDYDVRSNDKLPDTYDVDFFVGDLAAHPMHQTLPVNGDRTIPIYLDGQGLDVAPGYYDYQLTFHSAHCSSSDTTVRGSVTVRYPIDIFSPSWDNFVGLVNATYNAGHWSFCPPYEWHIWSGEGVDKTALVAPDKMLPYIASDALQEGDVIEAMLMREGYGRAVPTCSYIFTPVLSGGQHPIIVYPTVAARSSAIQVETPQSTRFELYDYLGHVCQQGHLVAGTSLLTLPAVTGCYLLRLTMEDGGTMTQTIMAY